METSSPSSTDLGASTWLAVTDDLLWGFNHALSNRLAAITSITKILEYSDTGLDPLLTALSDEIVTLERTLDLLRLVPRNPEGMLEAARLEDLLPEVLRLHQVRGELRELDYLLTFAGEPQAILVEPASLNHALLVGLGAVARSVLNVGESRVECAVTSSDFGVVLCVEGRVSGMTTAGQTGPCSEGELQLIGRLIAPFGGEVSQGSPDGRQDQRVRLTIDLPTLRFVREREGRQS